MRPVNLIPSDIKRKLGHRDTGPAPYIITAGLVLVVAGILLYVLTANQITDKKGELATIGSQIGDVERQTSLLSDYAKFASLKETRVLGVAAVSQARFPWAKVISDISKSLPSDAWLMEMTARLSPNAKTGEKSGTASSGNDSSGNNKVILPGPNVILVGCTYRQSSLARMMTRLKNVYGSAQVLLSSSEEKDENDTSNGSTGTNNTSDCRTKPNIHKFTVTITFQPDAASTLVENLNKTSSNSGTTGATSSQPKPSPSPAPNTGSPSGSTPVSGNGGGAP